MISFVHPGFFYASAAAATAVVALHFLVAEQPRAGMLPTVRFFPDVDVRSTKLAVRLSDVLLMLIRVATLLLIGAALGQPRLKPARSAVVRILALDVSGDAADAKEVADSARPYLRAASAVVMFDSVAKEISPNGAARALGGVRENDFSHSGGSLSSALIVALRAASRLREHADSIELVLVSPLLAEERDSATAAIRALWPGRIQLARVAARGEAKPLAAKTEWADSGSSRIWTARGKADTIGGIAFAGQAIIYPFERKWRLAPGDTAVRVTGRWIDGEPAIVEKATPDGCVRSISVPLPAKGDAVLRPSFARFLDDVSAPCRRADVSPLTPDAVAALGGESHLAPAAAFAPESARMTPLGPWLLVAALVLALLELFVRRRRAA